MLLSVKEGQSNVFVVYFVYCARDMIITNTSEDRRKGDENRYSHKVKKGQLEKKRERENKCPLTKLIYNFLLPKILNNEEF